ncbi:MAG: tetratricopeptide repeat protein [Desulfocapsa sp.]|nr:tetratricopeptide repeat protein [Desulfocapsa sp.]
MKKRYLTSFILIGLIPFLGSCASKTDIDTLNYQVRSINKKIDDMKVNTVDQMQQRQASSSGMLDQLQVDILQLKSKLEENAHMSRMLQEQNKEFQLALQNLQNEQKEQLNKQLAEIDSKISLQEESLAAIQQARVEDAERRSKAAAKAAADAMRKAQQANAEQAAMERTGTLHLTPDSKKVLITPSTSSSKITIQPVSTPSATVPEAAKPVSTETTAPAAVEPLDNYAQAQQKFRDGQYKEAFDLFEEYATKKGSDKSTITARYMMGECLFKQGEYDQAIIQYQQIISNFPGNPQAATALLRQGEAFEQLSDNETAKIIYKKLIASYGSSPEAVTAKKRISSL